MTLRPPQALHEALAKCAQKQGVSLNALAINLFWQYINGGEELGNCGCANKI